MLIRRLVLALIRMARRLFYNTPVHRLKAVNWLYERLFHAAFRRGDVLRVDFRGAGFFLPTDDITIMPTVLSGDYERLEFDLLRRLVRNGMTFADVGANIGLHSVLASRAVGEEGHVFAFEPEARNHALLIRNLEANGCTNVTVMQAAVGEHSGTMPLYLAPGGSIGTHSLLGSSRDAEPAREEVPVIRLDEYFKTAGRRLDVLKVDVEGYEGFVLRGAKRLLADVELLFVEYNRDSLEATCGIDDFAELVGTFKFLYRLDERSSELVNLSWADLRGRRYANLIASRTPIAVF